MINPVKKVEQFDARKSSLSSKMFSQLSMSFYGESTIRKDKQVIMEDCDQNFREA